MSESVCFVEAEIAPLEHTLAARDWSQGRSTGVEGLSIMRREER